MDLRVSKIEQLYLTHHITYLRYMSRIKVAVLFGGRSTEHEISLLSARNIIASIDPEKYETVLVAIDKTGRWFYQGNTMKVEDNRESDMLELRGMDTEVLFSQNTGAHAISSVGQQMSAPLATVDVIWPVLHGTYGEDGAIQGLAKLADLPCVGPGILGSAVGMDKEVMKRLLRDAGIKSAKWITLRKGDPIIPDYKSVAQELGKELFIKPVNLGSSVGISHVRSEVEYRPAIDHAFQYDTKVIIEERVRGREIECAVLGNYSPKASIPGEVVPVDGFYSYEAKYLDEKGAKLQIPAILNADQVVKIQELAIETFVILECLGMARVDMFLTPDEDLYINEINTLPGFTDISMYPELWKATGVSNQELVDELIQLAIEAHKQESQLKREA